MSGGTFIKVSPLVLAKRYANQELKGKASVSELEWLREHLVMWLRALVILEKELCTHNTNDNTKLLKLKPKSGLVDPSLAYMNAKVQLAETRQARLYFLGIVNSRKEEVKALIGSDALLHRMTIGDLVEIFIELDEMAKVGDLVDIRDKVNALVKIITNAMLEGK